MSISARAGLTPDSRAKPATAVGLRGMGDRSYAVWVERNQLEQASRTRRRELRRLGRAQRLAARSRLRAARAEERARVLECTAQILASRRG